VDCGKATINRGGVQIAICGSPGGCKNARGNIGRIKPTSTLMSISPTKAAAGLFGSSAGARPERARQLRALCRSWCAHIPDRACSTTANLLAAQGLNPIPLIIPAVALLTLWPPSPCARICVGKLAHHQIDVDEPSPILERHMVDAAGGHASLVQRM